MATSEIDHARKENSKEFGWGLLQATLTVIGMGTLALIIGAYGYPTVGGLLQALPIVLTLITAAQEFRHGGKSLALGMVSGLSVCCAAWMLIGLPILFFRHG